VDGGGIALRPGGASVGVNAAQGKSAGRTGPKVPAFTATARRSRSVGAFFPIRPGGRTDEPGSRREIELCRVIAETLSAGAAS
jgi:hypothetical protein